MPHDPGDRILGSALLQGKVPWTLLVDVLLRRETVPREGSEAVRVLLEEGVLTATDVAGLESTEAGLPVGVLPPDTRVSDGTGSRGSSEAAARILTALAIPQWRHYRNLRFIGEGGMGRIYKGFDGTLRRMVALKFLRRLEPQLVARFILEAQLQGGLEHPNICRVYEVGDWQGQAYIAMQYVKGETLDVAAAKLTLREQVEVMEAVASAIHYAHRQGLIHRDIKPANILVERPEGQAPHPFVLDFGLARGLQASGLTVDGQVVGTYHFMAPEQARGASEAIDRRSDVYSLGATLYAILGGKPPYWDIEGVEVLRRTLQEEPVPLGQVVEGLPEDLQTIVHKCLEKEPAQRYDSARALAEDLRRWLDEEPILARRPTLRYRAGKYVRRHKALVAAVALAVAVSLTFAGLAVGSWASARSRARYAQMFGQEAERLEALLRYVHLQPAHDIREELRQARQRMEVLDRRAAQAGRAAAGPAAYALGRARLALGEPEAALALLRQAWEGGLRIPEVALALGRATGQVYQLELARARMLERAELREARIREVQQAFRRPALDLLRQGASAALESPAYHGALMAFYESDWGTALREARLAATQSPWLYEARRLQGLALLEQAREAKEPLAAEAGLQEAVQAFRSAQQLAPSAPHLCMDEARTWEDVLRRKRDRGTGRVEDLQPLREAVVRARAMDPGHPEPPALLAAALSQAVSSMSLAPELRQAWQEEHQRLSAEALALGPEHREALLARARSLTWVIDLVGNTTSENAAAMEEALSLTERGQRLFPSDPAFLLMDGSLAHRAMTMEMYRGGSPWPSFERGLQAAVRYRNLRPELLDGYRWIASLWIERAEYERTHGLDPEASVAQALTSIRAVEGRGFQNARLTKMRGDALLIQGQHHVRMGTGGEGSLEAALKAYLDASSAGGRLDSARINATEAALWLGKGALNRGEDPSPWVASARGHLPASGRGGQHSESTFYESYLVASLGLVEARWATRQGSDVAPILGRIGSLAARWEPRSHTPHFALISSQVAYWAYCAQGRRRDLEAGLAAARRALERDPRCGEAHLWMAALHAEAHRRGEVGSHQARELELRQALELDRNLAVEAQRLKLTR